jgi:hypothetical protein
MPMKKRLRKQFHKRYLSDVIYDVSQASFWRKILFEHEEHLPFALTDLALRGTSHFPSTLHLVRRYQLKYQVSKVPHSQTQGRQGYEDCVMFRFQATEFPEIYGFSANNPEVI